MGLCNWAPCCRQRGRHDFKPKPTPLPWTKLLVLCSVLFVNHFGIMMIFPFLPFMVHDFFPYLDKTELGHKAGYLGSAYFAGNFFASPVWGWASDKVGRKPTLLLGICGIIGSELLFGFSQNFGWAIAARFLWGLLNGNLGVAKTYISEICDDSNQAKGFVTIGTSAGMGRLVGSIAGGFLAQPASKYSPFKLPFFCKYPYLLPCLVGAALGLTSFIASCLFLSESLDTKKKDLNEDSLFDDGDTSSESQSNQKTLNSVDSSDSGIEIMHQLDSKNSDSDTEMIDLTPSETDTEQLIMAESDIDTESDFETVTSDTELLIRERNEIENTNAQSLQRRRTLKDHCNPLASLAKMKTRLLNCFSSLAACVTCIANYDYKVKCTPRNTRSAATKLARATGRNFKQIFELLKDRQIFVSTLLYGLMCFLAIITQELLPLLLVTDFIHGGYSLDDNEIGVFLTAGGIFQLLFQLLVYPRLSKCLGYRNTLRFGITLFAIVCFVLPFSNKITGPISDGGDDFSGSGSGSGSGLNTTDLDYCGNNISSSSTDTLINENSVKRIPAHVWVVLGLLSGILVISRTVSFTSLMVLIGNSTQSKTRGLVNGYGQSLAALGRCLGPVVGAPIFAWSESTGKGWPLNHHFTFDLLAVSSVIVVVVTLLLPKTIEKKRDTLERETAVSVGEKT